MRGVLVRRHLGPAPPAGHCAMRRAGSLIVAPRLRITRVYGARGYLGSGCGRRRAGGGPRRWRTRRPIQPRRSATCTPPPTATSSLAASPARGGGAFGFGDSGAAEGRRQIVQEVDVPGPQRAWAKEQSDSFNFSFSFVSLGCLDAPHYRKNSGLTLDRAETARPDS
jgi:hypothetical protein